MARARGLVPVGTNGELVEVEFEIPDRIAKLITDEPLHISIRGEDLQNLEDPHAEPPC